jgi:hypothetical protein
MLVHSPSFHPSFSSHFAVKLWGSPVAEEKASGAFGAPEIPWYLKPFRAKTYTDFIGGQFEAGDNKDLLSGIPQATAFAKAAASPLETAKTIGQGAWDFLGKPVVEGATRSLVAQEGAPLFDDGGQYVSGAKMEKLDPFNAASIAPIGAFGARAAGLTDDLGHLGSFAGKMPEAGPAREPIRAYHGTNSAFDKFDRIDGGNARGDAVYFATDPKTASAYAMGDTNRITPKGNAGPNVLPVDIDARLFDENALVSAEERRQAAEIMNRLTEERAGRALFPDEVMDPKEFSTTWFDKAYKPHGYNVLQSFSYDPNEQNALLKALGYQGRVGGAHGTGGARGGQDIALWDRGTVKSATTGETLFSNDDSAALPGTILNAVEQGKPQGIRAYHGSPRAIEGPFLGAGDSMFVATDPALASAYASMHVGGRASPNVMPLDVTFENLMPPGAYKARDLDKFGGVSIQDYARARGHDGVDYGDGVYASVKPGTVRSATTGDLIFSNDESAALPGTIINAASELPMDQASRLARAKEMGFDVDNPLFHGTTKKFDEFADRPTFFAPERGVAAAYAKPYSGPRGEVGEYFIKPGNQVDFVGAGGDILRRVAGEIGVPSSKLREALDQGSLYNYFDEDTEAGFFSALKSLGYDSAKLPDAHPYTGAITESVVALDPKNIRSVNAAFDPSKSDSAFLLAANDKNASLPALVTNALEQQPQGIKAYHGSPHDFDRFDLSKIGTGEGAQAYGHGLYFAESEDVARAYRDALSRPGPSGDAGADLAQFQFSNARGDASKAAQYLRNEMGYYDKKGWPTPDYRLQYEDALARLERGDFQSPGRMYEVNIKANPEQFLDWDLPLGQQSPAVIAALEKLGVRGESALRGNTGKDLIPNYPETSQALREAGIPGIRYLDQGSRGAGQGSRNYVLFDDSLVDILKKYANPAEAAIPAEILELYQSLPERAFAPNDGKKGSGK